LVWIHDQLSVFSSKLIVALATQYTFDFHLISHKVITKKNYWCCRFWSG